MSALDIALDMLRSEVGVYAPQEHDPVEAARAELAALREAKIEAHAQRCRADILAECNDALRAALVTVGVPITHEVLAEAVRVKAEIEKLRRFDQDHDDQVSAFNQGWGASSWDAARDMGEDAEMGYAWRHFAALRAEIDSWRTFAAHLAEHLHGWDKSFPVPSEPDEQASYRCSLLARADVVSAQHARMRAALERLRDCDWTISAGDRMDAVREIAREALRG